MPTKTTVYRWDREQVIAAVRAEIEAGNKRVAEIVESKASLSNDEFTQYQTEVTKLETLIESMAVILMMLEEEGDNKFWCKQCRKFVEGRPERCDGLYD